MVSEQAYRTALKRDEFDLAITFGRVVREARLHAGLTQRGLDAAMHWPTPLLELCELGRRRPTLGLMFRLEAVLALESGSLAHRTFERFKQQKDRHP